MWLSAVILVVLVIAAAVLLGLWMLSGGDYGDYDTAGGFGLLFGIASAVMFFFILGMSSFSVPTGNIAVEKDFGGAYTGKVYTTPGYHAFAHAPSYGVKQVDVRNNKLPVEVNVMKDKTYNVNASVEVVYDLEPDKVVNLLSNYSDYKNTVIGATIKQVLTSNNTLANSQSLSAEDEAQIKQKLNNYGIKVTNIYMNSYKLTNSSNFGVNVNGNNNGNNN